MVMGLLTRGGNPPGADAHLMERLARCDAYHMEL
jgi:hypothetical protein